MSQKVIFIFQQLAEHKDSLYVALSMFSSGIASLGLILVLLLSTLARV